MRILIVEDEKRIQDFLSRGLESAGYAVDVAPDGAFSEGSLIQDPLGTLYGISGAGGAHGDGTVFTITTTGNYSTIGSFDGTDGGHSESGLLRSSTGDLFGVTCLGGTAGNGVIFELKNGVAGAATNFVVNSIPVSPRDRRAESPTATSIRSM